MFLRRKANNHGSINEELEQTYNDCTNLTIKNLTLEEQHKEEEALKGWKSLHTSLLFKLDVFDKQSTKLSGEELRIMNELREIRDQNVKHLVRVQLKVEEIERRRALNAISSSSAVYGSSSHLKTNLSIPSLRNGSSMNSLNSNRQMRKSLRPPSTQTQAKPNETASQAANKMWNRPTRSSPAPATDSLFLDFDQNSYHLHGNGNHNNGASEASSQQLKSNSLDGNWEAIHDESQPPNLIDLDTDPYTYESYNNMTKSLDDLSLHEERTSTNHQHPPPPPLPRKTTAPKSPAVGAISLVPSLLPPSQNQYQVQQQQQQQLESQQLYTPEKRVYVYNQPKPININKLMRQNQGPRPHSSTNRSPTRKPVTSTTKVTPAKKAPIGVNTTIPPTRLGLSVQQKKSNITYNYVKAPKKAIPPLASTRSRSSPAIQTKKPAPPTLSESKSTNEPGTPTSPTMDDILGHYGADNIGDDEVNDELDDDKVIESIRGIDHQAAKQILNDIVVHGDEVYWDDIVGLEQAKNSLKEAVVYPFLRPDLFKGLREPTRGMLLFGPPGTGKTMLARAVATESKSTFFSITASSLTSKYLGESEKLVKALFLLAKKLSPSIVFIDEIDSLLTSRSENEQESTRRIKNEFLVQWSELSAAAAGRDSDQQDDRVLVLGATNLPWQIDDAARRRFVKRQYIPLPEDEARKRQIKKLLKYQKNILSDDDYEKIIKLTEGFSGSDITALAKDSAMGPLRSLGDQLLSTPTEQIRPINLDDFKTSLNYIRPSVSKEGLEEYEKWASKFGSSGV
ncbi:uncharacterized protein KQ657_000463 [Scheffersomyces spartinae]|uniref:AAA+ ATPase domain-containing protein n=1 Tax=Scheffersomyces spartinae TaxID=45513 RepID=A0A9P8AJ35_9ASCO|nr:uncharacterized protein KQ657_000463 [Scheffersomyces spartinae]KAG7193771.1 hypothetical protein KQ657_000463 [Scheffersomyces spartinae]